MGKHNKAPSIRGRVSLPHDPRRQTDIILVFAEANSVSARLAREAGVTYVGAAELFEPLLNGEINPTKVLCTPGMLSAVTGRLARFLGPKGLMPTARRGGVGEGEGLVERIQEARGAMDWKTNGWGVVRCGTLRLCFFLCVANAQRSDECHLQLQRWKKTLGQSSNQSGMACRPLPTRPSMSI